MYISILLILTNLAINIYTRLHEATQSCIRIHWVTLNYTELHDVTHVYMRLHWITLNYTGLHEATLGYMRLHWVNMKLCTQAYTELPGATQVT